MVSLLTPEEYMKDKIFLGTKGITEIRSTGNTDSSSKGSGFIALFKNIGVADKNSDYEYENQQWLEILLYDGAHSYQGRLKPSDIHNVLEQQVQSQQQQTQIQGSQFTVNFLNTPTTTATKTTRMNIAKLEKIEKYLLGCELKIKDIDQIQIEFESQHSSLVTISITKLKHTCSFNVKLCEITLKKVVNNEYNNTKPCNDMLYIQIMTYIMQSQHSQISQTNAQIKDLTHNYERCKRNLLIMEKRVNSDSSNLIRNFLDLSNDTKAKHLRQLQQQKVTSLSEENNENTMGNDNTNKKKNGKSDINNMLTSANKKNDRKTKSKNSHVDNTTIRKKIKLREEEHQTHLSQINNNTSYLANNDIIEKFASGARVTDQDLFPQSQSLSQQQHQQTIIINNNCSRKEKYKTHNLSQSQYSQLSLQSISSANKQNRKNLLTKSTSSLSSISLMSTPLTSTQQLNSEKDDKGSMSGSETVKIDSNSEILSSSMSVEVKPIIEKNNDIIVDQTENESNEEEDDEEEDDETVSSVELL